MRTVVEAPAKVNLALDVVGRRTDGYHLLRMVVQSVDLHDTVTLEDLGSAEPALEMEVRCDWPGIPTDNRNSVHKAALVFAEYVGLRRRLRISIVKRIPVSAGLGGESTDAAATLRGLNELYGTSLPVEVLRSLGSLVGADVPFCIGGGTALVEGIGDVVTPLTWDSPGVGFLLVKPPGSMSTAEVYRRLSRLVAPGDYPRPDVDGLLAWMSSPGLRSPCPQSTVAGFFQNSLEAITAHEIPAIVALKADLLGMGALASVMTGHGPTVVGVFDYARLQELSALDEALPGMWCARAQATLGA